MDFNIAPDAFAKKLLALQPPENLKPGVVMVGILPHDIPPSSNFDAPDVMWIKCQSVTMIETLIKAYNNKRPERIALLHNDRPLEGTTRLTTLTPAAPQFLALQAIKASQLYQRELARDLGRLPLGDISKTANVQRTPLPSSGAKHPALSNGATHIAQAASPVPSPVPIPPTTQAVPTADPDRLMSSPVNSNSPRNSELQSDAESDTLPEAHEPMREEDFHIDLEDENGIQDPAPARMTLAELFDGRTPEQLEKSVEMGVVLLDGIQKTLESQSAQDTNQWLVAIKNTREQAKRSTTVVGVVGATGAGKSSVINAMLEEERLVPTNCMRACTAVVTEISYNYDEDGYKAEVDFITPADWEKQLKILFQELLDGNGQVSRDCSNEDSEAGIAYAQIKAVYPKMTKEEIESTTVDRLMAHNNVKCLGTVRKLHSDDPLMFYKKLQHYVDSKEKSSKGDKDKGQAREQEFWPLIRVVRLYVKSNALSTGAVIVDLPGVHDSNQARAAVAQNYMKQCTGLWIVAPITRAVDDKSAKHLLGDTFKRQLKLDGGFSDVTFICSKTDDISLMEAQDSLGLEGELGPMWEQSEELSQKKSELKKSIENLKETKVSDCSSIVSPTLSRAIAQGMASPSSSFPLPSDCNANGLQIDMTAAMDQLDDELEVWNDLSERRSNDETVFKPKPKSHKRKRASKSISSRKKSKYTDPDSDDDFIDDASDHENDDDAHSDDESSEVDEEQGEPLTDDEIAAKIAELKATKKDARRERLKIDDEVKSMRRQIAELDKQAVDIDAVISAKCIAGRNDYSREAIRQDYAAGIRELDQELAEEQDAANFDPEQDSRDYDEVARNLPVFCVSARAYQKLKGRLVKDRSPPGFKHIDETEMPALQAHCIRLTGKSRQASSRRFLTSLFQILNSLRLWASNDGSGRNLTESQLAREATILKEKLNKLDNVLEESVNKLVKSIKDDLQDRLYDVMPPAIQAAKLKASDTAAGWGAHRSEGGLYWATYKATCRRVGIFSGSGGLHNFNAELLEPVLQRLAGPWETIFTRRLPHVLNTLPSTAGNVLAVFHSDQEKRAARNGASLASFQMLQQQIAVYRETLKDAMDEARAQITEKQRDANRELEPKLTQHMLLAYELCVDECGGGSFKRMKAHMLEQVDKEKATMFDECVDHVKGLIKTLLKEVKNTLLDRVEGIYVAMERDYTSVVLGQEPSSGAPLPREHRTMRKQILEKLDGAELMFKRAVGLEPWPTPEAELGEKEETATEAAADDTAVAQDSEHAEEAVGAKDTTRVEPQPEQAAAPAEGVSEAAAAAPTSDVKMEDI